MTDSPQTVLRRSAQALAGRTRHVSVRTDRLEAYLEEVARRDQQQRYDPAPDETSSAEERVSFVLLRDATNFGSGWHPHLNKEPGISGARTTGVRLARWLAENGVPSAEQLSKTTAEHCAIVFGQSMTEPVAELMALFADAWRQLGEALGNRFGGATATWLQPLIGRPCNLQHCLGRLAISMTSTSTMAYSSRFSSGHSWRHMTSACSAQATIVADFTISIS